MKIIYEDFNTHIEDSYKVKDIEEIVGLIIHERYKKFLPITREFESYVREWKAHNRLYKLGLFRSHTKDCDLEEPIKWYHEIIYFILGVIP